MTGAGAPGGIGISKCLKKDKNIRLYVSDANPMANGRFMNKSRFLLTENAKNEHFIPQILNICKQKDIKIIFPLVTLELFKFAENKALFEKEGIKIIVSDKSQLDIANNKSRLYEHLSQHNILTPQYRVVQKGDFDAFLNGLKELGYPLKPICMKPSVSNGSRGVRIIDNSIDKFDLLFNQKPNNLYTSFEEMSAILRGRDFPEILLSEVLPFEEYTIDTIVNNGKPILILPRIRKKMNNGISVEGQFVENQEIIQYCRTIIESLKLHGCIGLQVKKAEDGRFKILEINPRIQGTSMAAMGLGINLPLIAVYQELGLPYEMPPVKWGLSFSRYYNEVFY